MVIWLLPESLFSLMVASGMSLISPVHPQLSAQCWGPIKLSVLTLNPLFCSVPAALSAIHGWPGLGCPPHAFAGLLEQLSPKASLGTLGWEQHWADDRKPT